MNHLRFARSGRFLLAALLLGCWTLAALGDDAVAPIGGAKKQRLTILDAAVDVSALGQGKRAMAAVQFEVKEGFHAQSHTPKQDNIKFEIVLDDQAALKFGEPLYPKGA